MLSEFLAGSSISGHLASSLRKESQTDQEAAKLIGHCALSLGPVIRQKVRNSFKPIRFHDSKHSLLLMHALQNPRWSYFSREDIQMFYVQKVLPVLDFAG